MAYLNDDNGMVMPVAPMYGGGNNGFGNWGDSAWLFILLLLVCGGGFGGFGGMNGGLYPWMNSVQSTQAGFDQASTASALAGIQSGITQGFAGAESAACQRALTEQATAYNNQIAAMNQNFANAQALDARLDSIVLNQQKCCCDQSAATADLKYTIAQDGAATRSAAQDQGQKILDKLCQLEIDGLKERNVTLQNQLNMANFRESQEAQNNYLQSEMNALSQYLRPPVNPAFIVNPPYQAPTTGGTTTA